MSDIYTEATHLEQRLLDVLSGYQSRSSKMGPVAEIKIDLKQATWKSLEKFVLAVDNAKDTYGGKNGEGLGRARRAFRAFSNHAASARCFTALLPTQSNYGSVLFGGSVIILEAAHQVSATRKEIIEALDAIPSSLCLMTETVTLYQYNEHMHRACARLYCAVLEAYHFIVKWFDRNSFSMFNSMPA